MTDFLKGQTASIADIILVSDGGMTLFASLAQGAR